MALNIHFLRTATAILLFVVSVLAAVPARGNRLNGVKLSGDTDFGIAPSLSRSQYSTPELAHASVIEPTLPWIIAGGLALGAAFAFGTVGDGDDNVAGLPSDPVTPDLRPRADLVPSDFETPEYRRDYVLEMINASDKYALGGTGFGTLLALFDTGIDLDHSDLPNIRYTKSYFELGDDLHDIDGHGTHVAGIMAAAKNDFGMHGVAFDAQLAVFQGVEWEKSPRRRQSSLSALADATREASRMGAVAMNHSWVYANENDTTRLISEFSSRSELEHYLGIDLLDALDETLSSGMLSVFAAGNDAADQVSALGGIPALIPEYGNNILVVGAVDSHGKLAKFSNRCGIARDYCLVAPGTTVYSTLSKDAGHAASSFGYKSGTSMAAPMVSGAVAVLKSRFPELTGAEISQILRETATDLGAVGVDSVFGHGLLNLENAVSPQGRVAIMTGTDITEGKISLSDSHISGGAAARGLAEALSGKRIMATDAYDRGYYLNVSDLVSGQESHLDRKVRQLARVVSAEAHSVGAGGKISVTMSGLKDRSSSNSFDRTTTSSPYENLADGPLVDIGTAIGTAHLSFRGSIANENEYAAIELLAPIGNQSFLNFEFGQFNERGGFLGTKVTGAFGAGMSSQTRFARLGGAARLDRNTTLLAAVSFGNTIFQSSGIFSDGRSILSRAIGVEIKRKNIFQESDSFTIGVSHPLTLTGGKIIFNAPVGLAPPKDETRTTTVYRDRMEIDLDEDHVPTDVQVNYSTDFMGGRARLGGIWSPGAGGAYGIGGGLTLRF